MLSNPLRDEADIERLCREREPEGLRLEFKEKEDPATPALSKGDKKAIARAVTALANSDGGFLVFGVKTARGEEGDVASELRPIAEIRRFEANFALVCATQVGPELEGVNTNVITAGDAASGYLIATIPRSPRRPHMSMAPGEQRYYRRTFQGTEPMGPSEVRDMHLAIRDAVLEPDIDIGGASFTVHDDWCVAETTLEFGLRNVGDRACRHPFLRVLPPPHLPFEAVGAGYDAKMRAWKPLISPGELIHVGDRLRFFSLRMTARILFDGLRNAESAHDLLESVRLYDPSDDRRSNTIGDKREIDSFAFTVIFGAENATARSVAVTVPQVRAAPRILALASDAVGHVVAQRGVRWPSGWIQQLNHEAATITV